MSKENLADEFEVDGLRVEIHYDQDSESPRELDNVGTMSCWHKRYSLGDEQPKEDPDEWCLRLAQDIVGHDLEDTDEIEKIIDENFVMLPLVLFDHTVLSISTSSDRFRAQDSVGWDWGRVGWIWCSLEKAREEWSNPKGVWSDPIYGSHDGLTMTLRELVEKVLIQEVATYDEYLTGQVYGFVIKDADGDDLPGKYHDSCWGFYGRDFCNEEATESAKCIAKQILEDAMEIAQTTAVFGD